MKSNFPFSIFNFTLLSKSIGRTCSKKQKGFTLIELLVVISIIGVLAALALVSYTGTQKQARDTRRKSDLKQYQNALGEYSSKNKGLYPQRFSAQAVQVNLCNDLSLSPCVNDPKYDGINTNYMYYYLTNGTANNGLPVATSYIVYVKLENTTNTYWVVCSTGIIGKYVSASSPTLASCSSILP